MLDLDRPWTRPGPTRVQLGRDVALAVANAVLAVVSVELYRSAFGASLGWQGVEAFVWFGLAGLLLAGRRRFPLVVVLLESAVFVVIGERLQQLGVIFTIQIILFVALYSAWAWSGATRRLYATSVVVVVGMFGWLIWTFATEPGPPETGVGVLSSMSAAVVYSIAINVVYFFGAIAWGHVAWRSARQRAEIAERVERERDAAVRLREQAVQAERVRIARDLHDVVAHHVSGIGVQAAGAARVIDARPDDARRALDAIQTSSRQAVAQMHQVVALLRSDDDARGGPQPGLADLRELAVGSGRPTVTFRQVGEPFDVPQTIGLAVYRVAQEAVANLRRHARAATGTVVLRYLPGDDDVASAVEVEVVDDGRGAPTAAPADGAGGFGLTGIRERTAMHGGTCEIGPRPDGGFRVRVRLPVGAT